jgi:hypothetical protein
VPRNQGPWVRLRTLISVWVLNLLRRVAQLSGEAESMILGGVIVKDSQVKAQDLLRFPPPY